MKTHIVAIFGLFLALWLTVPSARANCASQNCAQPTVFAQAINLPPHVIARIQKQFGGRVVGVTPSAPRPGSNCREFSKDVTIEGRQKRAFGTACLQEDGSWRTENNYDVQILTGNGRIVIVTVDPTNGNILSVRN